MRDEEIKLCPFRIGTETRISCTVEGESFTKEFFMPCEKELCSAFYMVRDGYLRGERCKRLD